jgi:purine nucleoside permease
LALATMLVGPGVRALARSDEPAPLAIKVVIVTIFELGEDESDEPGEFQTWVERLPLPESLPFRRAIAACGSMPIGCPSRVSRGSRGSG